MIVVSWNAHLRHLLVKVLPSFSQRWSNSFLVNIINLWKSPTYNCLLYGWACLIRSFIYVKFKNNFKYVLTFGWIMFKNKQQWMDRTLICEKRHICPNSLLLRTDIFAFNFVKFWTTDIGYSAMLESNWMYFDWK